MSKKKIYFLLGGIVVFGIIVTVIMMFSQNAVEKNIYSINRNENIELLQEIASDAFSDANADFEQNAVEQMKNKIDPSPNLYGFIIKDDRIIFVRDDMATEMYRGQKLQYFIDIADKGAPYILSKYEVDDGELNFTLGIYTQKATLLDLYGIDKLERRTYICLALFIIACVMVLGITLDKLRRTQNESEQLKKNNQSKRSQIEQLQEMIKSDDDLKPRTAAASGVEDAHTHMVGSDIPDLYEQYEFKFYLNASHGIYINDELGDVHPHTWEICINAVKKDGGFVPFCDVEKSIDELLMDYQNKVINDYEPFGVINPTTENMTRYYLEIIQQTLSPMGWYVFSIEMGETPTKSYIISLL